jgi:hypothetical protein
MRTTRFTPCFELIVAGFLIMATAVNLGANPVTPLSPDDLNPGAKLITFAGLPVFSQPTTVDGVGFVLSDGSGADVAFDPMPLREFGPSEGTIIQNIVSGFLPLNLNFPDEINQLGFDMRTWPSATVNLTFTSHGVPIDFLSLPTHTTTSDPLSPLLFYGFQSSTPFDHVLLDVSGLNGFFEIDNVAFNSVPDTTDTWLLLGMGLMLVLVPRREFSKTP